MLLHSTNTHTHTHACNQYRFACFRDASLTLVSLFFSLALETLLRPGRARAGAYIFRISFNIISRKGGKGAPGGRRGDIEPMRTTRSTDGEFSCEAAPTCNFKSSSPGSPESGRPAKGTDGARYGEQTGGGNPRGFLSLQTHPITSLFSPSSPPPLSLSLSIYLSLYLSFSLWAPCDIEYRSDFLGAAVKFAFSISGTRRSARDESPGITRPESHRALRGGSPPRLESRR